MAVAALALNACGGSSSGAGESAVVERDGDTLSGVVREPHPQVDLVSLPSLSAPGETTEFRAEPGGLQVVYFGFTNCPDVCPTTLADLAIALRKIDADDAARVQVLFVTVDPERDLDRADNYVTSFVDDATAAGTLDTELIAEAGVPFGASWEVRTLDDGTVEVDHSPFLYAVDDTGHLVLSWQFGATSDDMSRDIEILLDRYDQ